MLIATFGPSTGWLGRTIVFENNVFVLQDHGSISPSDVMLYDQQGQLVWVNDEMRAYVAGCAQATAVPAPVTTVQAGTPLTSQPTARSATPKNKATAPMHQSVNKWHLILIAIVVAIGLVLMLPHGSKSPSAVSITPSTAGYTSLEKAYLTLARSEASSDSDALSKVSDYCNRYPNLSDVEATDFGVNLGIIEVTATDWSNKDPGPPSARWNAFDRDYTYALNAMSSAASQMAQGLDNSDPQTLQSADNLMNEGDNYLTTALGEQPLPK